MFGGGLQVRLNMYHKRKAYLEGMLTAESAKLDSQARFIVEIIESLVKHVILHVTAHTHCMYYIHVVCTF